MQGNYGSLRGNAVEETFARARIKTSTSFFCYGGSTDFKSAHHLRWTFTDYKYTLRLLYASMFFETWFDC